MTSARELKKIQDDKRLMAAYRAWHAQELADAIAGPHGAIISEIMSKLARLDLANGAALIAAVEAIDWRLVDAQVRFVLLHEINSAIADLRSCNRLPVIDDPLQGQALSVFQRVKGALFPLSTRNGVSATAAAYCGQRRWKDGKMNVPVKMPIMPLDSIDSYDDSVIGDDGATTTHGGFLPDGTVIRFTKVEKWLKKNDTADITGMVLVHLDTIRSEVEWGPDKKPVGPPRVLGPGETFKDTEALNELIPKERWVPGFEAGSLKGPIENQNVLILADMQSMDRLIWPSPLTTIGSAIAVRELNTRVQRMRQFRGLHVYAKVKLDKAPFPTKWNKSQQRPALTIVGWVTPSENGLAGVNVEALPATQPVQATPKLRAEPATSATAPVSWKEVREPSLSEEAEDSIPF